MPLAAPAKLTAKMRLFLSRINKTVVSSCRAARNPTAQRQERQVLTGLGKNLIYRCTAGKWLCFHRADNGNCPLE
jgi:hypothetical protein